MPVRDFRTDTVWSRGSSLLRARARSVRVRPWDRGYRRGRAWRTRVRSRPWRVLPQMPSRQRSYAS